MARILLADDELDLRQVLCEVLQREGHEVLLAADGGEVLPAMAREKPDLLILDVMLPGLDGFSLQTQIAKDPELRAIPVIIITAHRSFLAMFQDFRQVRATLAKPFKNEDLIGAVNGALRK
jgi:CheY-like chemotaxis protein